MPSPLVSVITPTLNSARTLELTLASVAAQTYPHIEHIVVDGGSTDETLDVLRQFRSTVPLRWLSEPDDGMYAAINKGLRLARGGILSYLNGDDLYFPWSVERAVAALRSTGSDVAFGDVLVLVRRGGRAQWAKIQFYPSFHPRIYAHEVNMGQPSVFWRRQVSDTVGGFDERMRYAGDFEYWLRTGTAGFRYTHVREGLAVAVEHEGALSTIHAEELRAEIVRTRANYADQLKPRRFARLREVTRLVHWRWQVLLFRFSLKRERPLNWVRLIDFLRRTEVNMRGGSIVRLLLPVPLPKTWSMWRLDPTDFETKLIEEIHGARQH
jgi:glycosyltransferase involved in cell wall biosynthesis